ncbi:hypothetical protein ACSQ67_025746 [Phaseolus vulgaris]
MSSGGCDQPKPYLSGQNKGKRVMKRKRPRYVLKVNIPPPPNAPIAHVPSPFPTPAHTSSPTPGLTPISTAASFPCPRTADIPFQSRRDNSPTTSSPTPSCGIGAFSISTGPSTSSITITIAKGYTIINTLTAIGRISSRLSQVGSEVASGSSPIDSAEEDRIRLESWLLAAGGKKKGRIYGVRVTSTTAGYPRGAQCGRHLVRKRSTPEVVVANLLDGLKRLLFDLFGAGGVNSTRSGYSIPPPRCSVDSRTLIGRC